MAAEANERRHVQVAEPLVSWDAGGAGAGGDDDIQTVSAQALQQKPAAAAKMGANSGKKLFPDLDRAFGSSRGKAGWSDGKESGGEAGGSGKKPQRQVDRSVSARFDLDRADEIVLLANASAQLVFRPAFAPHQLHHRRRPRSQPAQYCSSSSSSSSRHGDGGASIPLPLSRRGFDCIDATFSCAAIGHPNACCADGETCVEVEDTGLGPVGCCPKGTTCSGPVADCPSPGQACPAGMGGGCCIEGFICQDVGCEFLHLYLHFPFPLSLSLSP